MKNKNRKKRENTRYWNRREFIKTTFLASSLGLSYPVFGALASNGTSPNEKIRYALIGCGGQGMGHLAAIKQLKDKGYPVDIAAVCDVYMPRVENAAKFTGAKAVRDYRQILEMKDIDAVGIATPDHWHCKMVIEALDAGKDVYCEKPLTHWKDLTEAKRIADSVEKNNRVLQVGTQGMSDSIWDDIAEQIKKGAIGKIVNAQASDMRNGLFGLYDPMANDNNARPKVNLDWDMWLGPAPSREFFPGRFFAFRAFWDYSAGVGTDFLPHLLTPLVYVLGLDFPKTVNAFGTSTSYPDRNNPASKPETPDFYNLTIEYPNGIIIVLMASIANAVNIPHLIRGHEATVFINQSPGAVIFPEEPFAQWLEEIKIQRTRGGSIEEHYKNFFDCVKTRKKTRSNEQLALRVMAALNLGVLSFRSGKTVEFDPKLLGLEK